MPEKQTCFPVAGCSLIGPRLVPAASLFAEQQELLGMSYGLQAAVGNSQGATAHPLFRADPQDTIVHAYQCTKARVPSSEAATSCTVNLQEVRTCQVTNSWQTVKQAVNEPQATLQHTGYMSVSYFKSG